MIASCCQKWKCLMFMVAQGAVTESIYSVLKEGLILSAQEKALVLGHILFVQKVKIVVLAQVLAQAQAQVPAQVPAQDYLPTV